MINLPPVTGVIDGARTHENPLIKSQMLYQLSYDHIYRPQRDVTCDPRPGFNGSGVRHLPLLFRALLAICLSTAVLKLDHPFGSSLFRVISALHKVFQCYSFTSHCFRVGETHAQLRLECGSYIVSTRSLTKLATSITDQPCEGSLFLMVVPAGIEPATRGFSVPCSTD